MHPHEFWILLAAALFIGGCGGWLLGHWRAYQECCECCTCQDCAGDDFIDVPWPGGSDGRIAAPSGLATMPGGHAGPGHPRPGFASPEPGRHTILLEPGPTIYPALAVLAGEALDGPEIDGERPDTSTWLRTWRLGVEAAYPIPGTPQWEARHTALQEAL